MCIICVKPADVEVKESIIDNMWYNNSDGAGFMFVDDNKQLQVVKGLMTLKDFKEAYEPHKFRKMVLHFRIKTHGETNEENTHPFRIDENLAFVHNGVIKGFGSSTHSDTWHFNEELIKPLRQEFSSFLKSQPVTKLISEHIGYSKLVFMDSDEGITIINPHLGNESSDGFWFSNKSWETSSRMTVYTPPQKKRHNYTAESSNDANGNSAESSKELQNNWSSNRTFEINDLVYLNNHYKDHEPGEVGAVAWFTGGRSVAVSFESGTEYIPFVFLDKVLPLKMIKTIGHLNEKSNVFFVDEAPNGLQTRIYDVDKKKHYWIPVDSWVVIPKDDINVCNYVSAGALDEAANYGLSGMM